MIRENMNRKHIIVVIFLIFLTIILSGCTDDSSTNNIQKGIVGIWLQEEIQNHVTYRTYYEFLSNLSFFYRVWDSNSSSYTDNTRGTYEINEEYIYLTTPGVHTKWEVLVFPYSISEDENELKLYYSDGITYEAFVRES